MFHNFAFITPGYNYYKFGVYKHDKNACHKKLGHGRNCALLISYYKFGASINMIKLPITEKSDNNKSCALLITSDLKRDCIYLHIYMPQLIFSYPLK